MTSAGSPSATVIGPTVADGPRLDTCSVHTNGHPRVAVPVCDLSSARSEIDVNEVSSVSVLFTRFGSGVGEDDRRGVRRTLPRRRSGATSRRCSPSSTHPARAAPRCVQVTSLAGRGAGPGARRVDDRHERQADRQRVGDRHVGGRVGRSVVHHVERVGARRARREGRRCASSGSRGPPTSSPGTVLVAVLLAGVGSGVVPDDHRGVGEVPGHAGGDVRDDGDLRCDPAGGQHGRPGAGERLAGRRSPGSVQPVPTAET